MRSHSKPSLLRHLMAAVICLAMLMTAVAVPALAEEAVSDENLFNKNDPDFVEGYNYVQSTSEITEESSSFMTGYIAVQSGDIISVNLHSTRDADFVKYALFDTNMNWIDTIKTNYVSELTIRIFQDGFVRITVFGLEYEETITIFKSAQGAASAADIPESLLMSSNNTNIVVKTTEEDPEVFNKDWFDRSDPDFLDMHNYVQYTSSIVEESDSFITGYIPVGKGDAVTVSLNLDERTSPFIKCAYYNKNKEWLRNERFNYVTTVTLTMEEAGYLRFSINGRLFKNTASIYIHPSTKLFSDQQIEDVILPSIANTDRYMETFNQVYLSGETVDLFNRNDDSFEMDKGYSQLTGDVIDDEGSFLTGYIPVAAGQVIVVSFSQASEFAKYALYDSDRQWLTTSRVNNPTALIVPIEQAGYFRLHGHDNAINGTTITIPTVRKLDISAVSGDIGARLERLESTVSVIDQVDLIVFMGQSNMAGRGIVTEEFPEDAPAVTEGAGWEFRAVSDPTKLYPIDKYFGLYENVEGAINDGNSKTGGLVPAFVNAYYEKNGHVPVVGVSASEGGTSLVDWQPGTERFDDLLNRLTTSVAWLQDNGYHIRHQYIVWCQGETDDIEMEEWYITNFNAILNTLKEAGIEKCFMIRVGNSNPATQDKITLMETQNRICQNDKDVIMISTDLAGMLERGLMKDDLHYYQQAYNETGEHAGVNMAFYVMNGKEPFMYDPQFGDLYYSIVN